VTDRGKWKDIVPQAKVHSGLVVPVEEEQYLCKCEASPVVATPVRYVILYE
jgi:CDGSH-type Zn-finger protein